MTQHTITVRQQRRTLQKYTLLVTVRTVVTLAFTTFCSMVLYRMHFPDPALSPLSTLIGLLIFAAMVHTLYELVRGCYLLLSYWWESDEIIQTMYSMLKQRGRLK